MRFSKTTRVETAQSIITNWNKSAYVTIGTSLLPYKCPVADIVVLPLVINPRHQALVQIIHPKDQVKQYLLMIRIYIIT